MDAATPSRRELAQASSTRKLLTGGKQGCSNPGREWVWPGLMSVG